jgi:hypothetical protein
MVFYLFPFCIKVYNTTNGGKYMWVCKKKNRHSIFVANFHLYLEARTWSCIFAKIIETPCL